jgi:hypothetical protein
MGVKVIGIHLLLTNGRLINLKKFLFKPTFIPRGCKDCKFLIHLFSIVLRLSSFQLTLLISTKNVKSLME